MNPKFNSVKGIIFDYGATLDTNGRHWAEVLWEAYKNQNIPVTKEQFREAYIHGERTLATQPLVKPHHVFLDVLQIKAELQISHLVDKEWLPREKEIQAHPGRIAEWCDIYARKNVERSKSIVKTLTNKYKLVLVSNFYGNIHSVLKNFDLLCSFEEVVESSVVGVRKPDPKIFTLGVEALKMSPDETVVIGDSFSKDIIPAGQAGCRTIWLKGEGWDSEGDESVPDAVITDIREVADLLV